MHNLFRVVCLAYPHEFRRRYFAQIIGDFDQHEREYAGGFPYLLQMLCDVITSGLALRFEMMLRDISTALRRLRQSPLLVVIMVLTFALGIGANLTVFSVLNAVLLQPMPYANAARLVAIRIENARDGGTYTDTFSVPDLHDFRTQSKTLQNATGFYQDTRTLTGYGKPVALDALTVTWRFFDTLGVKPQLGRFASEPRSLHALDTQVVISDALWRSRFHAAPDIIGRTIMLDGVATQIIAVAPPGLQSPDPYGTGFYRTDVWTYLPETAPANMRGWRYLFAIGLLRPGVSLAAARADISRVQRELAVHYPRSDKGNYTIVDTLRTAIFGNGAAATLWMIFAAVLGVFLIMCANVANLLLTQTNARTHELTMRMALGASRARIMKQLLTESGVLAVLGGIAGIAIAYVALHEFVLLGRDQLPRLASASIDLPVLVYGTCIVILAALLAGAAPAWILASSRALASVRTASRSGAGSNRRLQSSLVVLEIALALALVTACGLSLRSFYALTHADLGVRSAGVLMSDALSFPARRYPTLGSKIVVQDRLQRDLARIPGTTSALAISHPMGNWEIASGVDIAGRRFTPNNQPDAVYNAISAGYFTVLGIELRRGRFFNEADSSQSQPVAIVSQAFAKYFPPDTPLVGKRIRVQLRNITRYREWMTIVGVVADTRDGPTDVAKPEVYVPLAQSNNDWITAVVYAPHAASNTVRAAISGAFADADPLEQPPAVATMPELLANSAASTRLSAALFTALGIIALALAIAGIFGVVSYSVSQRIAEFGIRMAIGSTPAAIVRNVLAGVALLLAIGVAIGLVLAALAGHTLGPNLYGVNGIDAATLVVVTAILASTALIAGALPALRAARVDPATALRYE